MFVDLKHRIDQPELMDTQKLPAPVMEQTLRFLKFTNRHLGGSDVILRFLERGAARWEKDKPIRILDVGTGDAEIPKAIIEWALHSGRNVRVTGVDLMPDIVAIAEKNLAGVAGIEVRQDDFFRMAERNESFDYVIATLFLHHTPPQKSVEVLKTMDRLCTRGFIVSDLLRSTSSYWSINALCRLIGNPIVRHDGPLSVRRAFRVNELARLAQDAGLRYLAARREPYFRVSLSGEKT